ncbi:unnamed protein product [Amoebophrya sp. A120]|nr:unnamed protein product [Amoebophrya sp. A120]|eukprot:GSA120T00010584001.1
MARSSSLPRTAQAAAPTSILPPHEKVSAGGKILGGQRRARISSRWAAQQPAASTPPKRPGLCRQLCHGPGFEPPALISIERPSQRPRPGVSVLARAGPAPVACLSNCSLACCVGRWGSLPRGAVSYIYRAPKGAPLPPPFFHSCAGVLPASGCAHSLPARAA